MEDARFEGSGGHAGVSSRVQAVVDYCGPSDFTEGSAGIQGGTADKDSTAPLGLFGVPFREKPVLWKDGSPALYVKRSNPPFLIVHGDKDKTVSVAHGQKLAAALKKAGAPVELIIVKGGGHGMTAGPGEPPAEPNREALDAAVLAFFDKVLKK
jgi:dipeptidyl aminopeptidase/acylaminoacyl peptidase